MKILKLLVVLILIVITYYSVKITGDSDLPTNDKVGHFLAYATLSIHLLLLCKTKLQNLVAVLFAIGYSLLMEIIQGFIPERDPSLSDMLANTTGVFIGITVIYFLKSKIVSTYKLLRIIAIDN